MLAPATHYRQVLHPARAKRLARALAPSQVAHLQEQPPHYYAQATRDRHYCQTGYLARACQR